MRISPEAPERPDLAFHIVGVNAFGYDSGLADICDVADLPVLQDDDDALVWRRWDASWRDVIILDKANQPFATFSPSSHNLSDPESC